MKLSTSPISSVARREKKKKKKELILIELTPMCNRLEHSVTFIFDLRDRREISIVIQRLIIMSQLDKNLIILRERRLNLKVIEGITLVILTHKKFN